VLVPSGVSRYSRLGPIFWLGLLSTDQVPVFEVCAVPLSMMDCGVGWLVW
jgi:hypothetical protein